MNWVGGSRNRLMMKNDTRKQREFFEKRKMQNKLKNIEVATPSSSQVSSLANMDLLTMFVVNQIAAKKELKDPPSVSVLGSKGGRKKRSANPLVLPMSPGSPSELILVESQPQCSGQSGRTKQIIPQAFKMRQLSPVAECSFSDNSVANYVPPKAEHHSPFSSSSSSGRIFQQGGHSQPLPDWFPPPWDTSGLDHSTFQPFCEPRGLPEDIVWSSNPVTQAAALFGTPDAATHHPRSEDIFLSLSQPEPTLDFTLNQTGSEQKFEDNIFKGFTCDEYETDACHFGSEKMKIFLKEETSVQASAPQTVPEPQSAGVQHPNCNLNFTCPEYPMNCKGYSPTSSFKWGYLSSASSDGEECCHPLRIPQGRDPAKSQMICACKKAASEKRDAQTQTILECASEKFDVATQCSLLSEPSPAIVSRQQKATREHAGCTQAPRVPETGRKQTLYRKKKSNFLDILNPDRQRGMQQSPLEQYPPDEAKLDNAATTTMEGETLQEIDDILLQLKQRKEEE
ncbi:uncharacterized protein redic1 isoform X2 [Vanacampus margaritifer]